MPPCDVLPVNGLDGAWGQTRRNEQHAKLPHLRSAKASKLIEAPLNPKASIGVAARHSNFCPPREFLVQRGGARTARCPC